MNSKTYIYKGKEYKLTGRTAYKTVRKQQKMLQEIKPITAFDDSSEFNVWVDVTELYEVVISNDTEE